MNSKFLILLLISSFVSFGCFAQGNGRILPLLEANPSVRNAGMGNVMLDNTDQMFLYVNPSAFIFSQNKFSADFSTEIYPKSELGRLMQYNLSGGFKINSKNALFIGARNQRGLTIPSTSSLSGDKIKPCEWTADIGYAFAVTPEFVVYVSGSYLNSAIDTKAHGWALSVGAGYQKKLQVGSNPAMIMLGARLLDAGKSIKYNNTGLPYNLPTSVVAGGNFEITFSERHKIDYAISGRVFMQKGSRELFIGNGAEYTFSNIISARVGYQYGYKSSDRLTFGLGVRYANCKLDVSYGNTFDIYGVNTLLVGLGVSF